MLYHSTKNSTALIFNTNILKLNETTKNRNKRPPENIYINECFPKNKSQPLNYKAVGFYCYTTYYFLTFSLSFQTLQLSSHPTLVLSSQNTVSSYYAHTNISNALILCQNSHDY